METEENNKNPCPFPNFESEYSSIHNEYHDDIFFEEAFSSQKTKASDPNRSFLHDTVSKFRTKAVIVAVFLIFGIFLCRTAYLQIIKGDEYKLLAEENRVIHHTLISQRGIIYDRNGIALSKNTPTFNIIISSSIINEPLYQDKLQTLAKQLSVSLEEIKESTKAILSPTDILFARHVSYDQALSIMAQKSEYPWISVETNALRQYVTDSIPSLSHILGYTGIINEDEYLNYKFAGYRSFDPIGKQGLEKQYEQLLRGNYGEELLEVDAMGNVERILAKTNPENGQNLYTTLDSNLQSYIETVLEERMKGTNTAKASVIVMDPNNGEVLSLVSWPAYDANLFSAGIDQESYSKLIEDINQPLFPRATSGEFPSGSTIKPIYAAAALIEHIITPSTSFLSTGGIWVSVWFFPDWKAGGHGVTNIYHAIADSVNTFFYYIGGGVDDFEGLGLERMMDYLKLFGFGLMTGIDLPGEADGFLPSKQWKEETKGEQWYIGDTYHVAIGQGDLLVTPVQITQAISVFANGGSLVNPHLNSEFSTQSTKIIDDWTAEVVRDAMRETVTNGSATMLQSVPVSVAGKTGTAQWSTNGTPHSWFAGFAPFDDPQITITILIEEGGDDYLAVPVALDILTYWFSAER
ncbi:MAG: hypothetical protein UU40_C0002G0044 [Candidatus Uhrbacteria bacterium GW2011_GWD2_41_121]|uniref:Penicillin-binding protein 2 n=1 Tax=Candidatus Uhrbacteria bacterium GW2011_GWC1_41_20 TaxID=1618983 RepID=A0A0G0YHN8_9BACT|nr:MAG: hypothetical protein UT52_C0002G0044 [Candidatus Uhrbacteria bacterium GW2011_GWE1_39_46]KKR64527.1 MAG: hypothetical protein UU04_C0001G0044 [Candidatus Uhrbacteria bacterium GW2011_GWC2_40_450]KKR90599.1 MAG: hypothetical protein UU40_C0002G0044 [Candidatus Uhrbacteria bacterium GW2011_GWD2_41_121]KKR90815.1 MAG: hypothetical protein UU36_C0001G0020 [Candidatus Uhrbacteria bacterium GW2011_GWE2_41_1153]KKR96510.1 MAG: hypothetical protein UU46_C0002G0046 [Candidatus Uhrbacteria bacter